MKINVKVTTHAKQDCVKREGEIFKIYLTAPPVEGKANKALIHLLADHFKVRKGRIQIIKGLHSRNKTINIDDNLPDF